MVGEVDMNPDIKTLLKSINKTVLSIPTHLEATVPSLVLTQGELFVFQTFQLCKSCLKTCSNQPMVV